MTKDTKKRIDTIPTPRPSDGDGALKEPVGASRTAPLAATADTERAPARPRRGPAARGPEALTSSVTEVPHQQPASSPLVAVVPTAPPTAPRRRRVRRAVWVTVAATVVVALSAGSAAYAANDRALDTQDAELDATMRVDQAVVAGLRDVQRDQDADLLVATTVLAANRARAATRAQAAVDQANAVLAATPNAGDAPRAALAAASSAVAAAIVAPAMSSASLRRLVDGVAVPQQAAVAGQAAWQAAEAARVAAEQAAAAAAAQAAAARTTAKSAPRASRTTTTTRSSAGTAAAPAPAASSGIPAGGKVCTGSGGSGAGESSVGAIGAAINAYRASLGLPQLGVSRSSVLVSHAIDMANAGGIWHSGSDNIVACVSSGSASAMVSAWSHSAPHDAQMRRTDVSSMAVGGASLGGWLFGAVKFS